MTDFQQDLTRDGAAWLRTALAPDDIATLSECFGKDQPGQRIPRPADIMANTRLPELLDSHLPGYFPVRAVAFAKSDSANWTLPWHQDRVIAVEEKAERPGYDNWSLKGGVWHCEPPLECLQDMLFLRLHLDATGTETGAMEYAPGSHREGRISTALVDETAGRYPTVVEAARPGDILALSMLTLHRSRPSTTTARRRVIRLDLSRTELPPPLRWAL